MPKNTTLFNPIADYIDKLDSKSISQERKKVLQSLIDFVQERKSQNKPILLNFICTHNSRRSHLAQVWAQTLATYYNVNNVACYSGGTEATAVFPMVLQVLKKTGFEMAILSAGENPVCGIKYAKNADPIIGFSKKYDDIFNPQSEFAAIMTCSQADDGCPFVAGADERIVITYQDPKISDGTPEQEKIYSARSMQIATEMKYVFSQIMNIK